MSRKSAREHAFKLVYQMSFWDTSELSCALEKYYDNQPVRTADRDFVESLISGVLDNSEILDKLIAENSINWDLDRISKVDTAIMRISVFEMLKMDDISVGTSINEAVELAKKYGSDESPSFINGILGAVAKKARGARVQPTQLI
jgi:N utilization substance protein B